MNTSSLAETTRFPPVFENDPWTYGLSLFALTFVGAVSLALLCTILLEARHRRKIDVKVQNQLFHRHEAQDGSISVLTIYRIKTACLFATLTFVTMPRAGVMLAWGEASQSTMSAMFTINQIGDNLALFPFLTFIVMHILSDGVVGYRLGLDPTPVRFRMHWGHMGQKVKIGVFSMLIAVGVSLYKASM